MGLEGLMMAKETGDLGNLVPIGHVLDFNIKIIRHIGFK